MAVGDVYFTSVSLLAHLVSAAGGTTPEVKGKVITLQSGASIAADADFIGGNALSVGGAGACADTPGVAAFALGSGDFSVECSFKTTDTSGGILDGFVGGSTTSWQLTLDNGKLSWYAGTTKVATSTSNVNTGAKVAAAVTRANGTLRLFVNGVVEATVADATVYTFTATKLSIGRQASGSPSAATDFIGSIGEVRITKGLVNSGVARYTANYTVATSAFPEVGVLTPTTWSPTDKTSGVTLSNGNLTVSTTLSDAVRTLVGVSTGKWYWEVVWDSGFGPLIGAGVASTPLTGVLGFAAGSYALHCGNGNKQMNGGATAYMSAPAVGDRIGVMLDLDALTIAWTKNGVSGGVAGSILAGTYFPMVDGSTESGSSNATANFGATQFGSALPAGYNPGFGAPTLVLAGNVKNSAGANAARKISAFRQDTGALMGTTTSDATTGNYSIVTPWNGTHLIVAEPAAGETLDALIHRGVSPV